MSAPSRRSHMAPRRMTGARGRYNAGEPPPGRRSQGQGDEITRVNPGAGDAVSPARVRHSPTAGGAAPVERWVDLPPDENGQYEGEETLMEFLGWFFSTMFWLFYIVALFTVAWLTFKKGHIVLFIVGILVPFLWLIGAILPAKRGSRYEVEQEMRRQAMVDQMTQ
jgi:hypothetical protein